MNQSHPFQSLQHIANFCNHSNNHDKYVFQISHSHSTITIKRGLRKPLFSLSTMAQTQTYNRPDPTTDTMYHIQINNRNTVSSLLPAEVIMTFNAETPLPQLQCKTDKLRPTRNNYL